MVARVGGDEFVILYPEVAEDEVRERLVRKVVAVFDDPYAIGDHLLSLSGSVGVSRAPADGSSFRELLEHADNAMYRVKRERNHPVPPR
jgi:diguanylate cyclase (GGDEF)-like protein